MSQTEVARLAHGCLAEVLKETALRCGGKILEQDGLLLVSGTHPCPIFVNSALCTGYMTAGEAFGRASKFFSNIGHEYEFWIREKMMTSFLLSLCNRTCDSQRSYSEWYFMSPRKHRNCLRG